VRPWCEGQLRCRRALISVTVKTTAAGSPYVHPQVAKGEVLGAVVAFANPGVPCAEAFVKGGTLPPFGVF
jgi:hypothetical protein